MPSRTAVMFQTHFFDSVAAGLFRRLQRSCPPGHEAFVLMHVAPGTPKPPLLDTVPHHFVTTPEVRDPGYVNKSAGGPEWRIYNGGHVDLPILHFARHHPDFDHYWNIEYDVRFSGDWATFFRAFEGTDADFVSTTLRTAAVHPEWGLWKTLELPPAGVPTHPGKPLAGRDLVGCFMPVWRGSRRAMERMDRAYRDGWTGHCEVTWPTILQSAGYVLEDVGGDGEFSVPARRGRFYDNDWRNPPLAPGSFVFRPLRYLPGLRRNFLWHPVKPIQIAVREEYWALLRRLEQLRRRAGAGRVRVPQA